MDDIDYFIISKNRIHVDRQYNTVCDLQIFNLIDKSNIIAMQENMIFVTKIHNIHAFIQNHYFCSIRHLQQGETCMESNNKILVEYIVKTNAYTLQAKHCIPYKDGECMYHF